MKSMRGEQVKRKVFALLSATAVVAALVSITAPAGAAKPASGEPLQFGYINATSGANAVPSTKDALKAYVDDWNKRGGHDGQPIEVVIEDTGFDTGKQLRGGAHLRLRPEDGRDPGRSNLHGDHADIRDDPYPDPRSGGQHRHLCAGPVVHVHREFAGKHAPRTGVGDPTRASSTTA